jgi:hypothetical protein
LALLVLLGSAGRVTPEPGAPRYAPQLLDCARYRVQVESDIVIQSGRQRTREHASRDGVMVLKASQSDSLVKLEAWFDTLALSREGSGERLTPDTDGLVGGRYRGDLTSFGGFTSTDTPFIPDEIAEIADLHGVLGDLLPQLPATPLKLGASWKDDLGTVISRSTDAMVGGRPVERYRLVRRTTRQESRVLPDSTEVSANRVETETGVYSWSAELGVIRWERDLTEEVSVPAGGLVKQPFKTGIGQKVTMVRLGGGCGK